MKISSTLLLSFILTLSLCSKGQEYSYINYDTREGLAGSTVYCALQDKEGFLWFGTETGLSRFDGTHFKNFTTADGLPDNEILKLMVDSRNRVWIMPFKNSVCYYWKGRIHNQENDSLLKKLRLEGDGRSVVEDRDGNILLTEDFSYTIIRKDGRISRVREINNRWFRIYQAGINTKGNFRLAMGFNFEPPAFVDIDTAGVQSVERSGRFFPTNGIIRIALATGLEAVQQKDSILFHRPGQKELFGFPVPDKFIDMSALNDSIFVINAAARCILYNVKQQKIDRELLDGHKVTAVVADNEGNLWFTTMGDGIFRFGSAEFRNIRLNDDKSSLSVFSIVKHDSSIFLGTDHLLLWELSPGTAKVVKHEISLPAQQQGRVMSMVADETSKLWVGTDVGVYNWPSTKKDILIIAAVKSLVYRQGRLIMAASEGVFDWNKNISVRRRDSISLWETRATCAFPYNNGFYIGTLNGLYELTEKKDVIFWGAKFPRLTSRISAITRTPDGIFWIATYGEGIIAFKDGNVIMNITRDNGLTSDICRNIFISGNNLWVGTDKGLNRITLHGFTYDVTRLSAADGLGSDMINAVFVDNGVVYVGTPRGLTYFREDKITNHSVCMLRVTAVSSSDHAWNFDTTNFVLPHHSNNIRFEFVGLSYKSAGDIVYKYRLMGLDSNWKTTNETFLSYPSLPSGDYELQLIAINKSGTESDIRLVSFSIKELLGEKTWFRLLILSLTVMIVLLGVRFYIRGIRKKEEEKANTLRRMAELEQMALKAQMNPHFIFNSLNSIQHYVMEKDIAGANRFITGFSSLMRQTLDFSSKQDITLKEELQYLCTYMELERIRLEDKFQYEIKVSPNMLDADYHIPPMILQPYVENSIRHGIGYRKDKLGKIVISAALQDGKLVCIVEDNGVGRLVAGQFKDITAAHHQSKGMSLTADRIEMFNQNNRNNIEITIRDLIDEQGNPLGTSVRISFPV